MVPADDVVSAQLLPDIVRLENNLYAIVFRLMKLLPAHFVLRQARRSGRLRADTTVVETTSGTFGLGLAMQCAVWRRPLTLVSDPVIDDGLRRRLEDLGATVEIVDGTGRPGGHQVARLERVAQIRAELGDTFFPNQYGNADNPASYGVVAKLALQALGRVDCLVGTVGSGGSMCGTTTALRTASPHTRAIGIDTHGSVLFGLPEGHRALRGLGNGLMPGNLDHRVFDEVHWLGEAQAHPATRSLHRRHALFMGPTSGAAFLVAQWWARRHPDAITAVIFADEGYRYQATVYDDDWLAARGIDADDVPEGPRVVGAPADVDGDWCVYDWKRRSLDEVV